VARYPPSAFLASLAALFCLTFLPGCGSPNAPNKNTPDPLFVKAGAQRVSITGYGISNVADFPECKPFGVPFAGTSILTTLILSNEGTDWVARSLSPEQGSLEIRFHSSGGFVFSQPALAGTATGSQLDTESGQAHAGVRFIIDGTASVEGSTLNFIFYALGRMTGTLRFVDDKGQTGNCTAVAWDLQPVF
jgi:hypothetical protein